jgi:hypothetical protein
MTKRCPKGMKLFNGKCFPDPKRLKSSSGNFINLTKESLSEIEEVDEYTTYVALQIAYDKDRPDRFKNDKDYPYREELHDAVLNKLDLNRRKSNIFAYSKIMKIIDQIIEDKIHRWHEVR